MAQAKLGDTVQVHYTGKLEDGTVFDTSRSRRPLQFTIGNGKVIEGFEQAVAGMTVGESKITTIPVEKAYGPRKDDMVVTMKRDQLQNVDPRIGQRLEITQEDDRTILVTVTNITDSTITVDANHPLAGKTLTFEIELLGIM
jgi:peptidylprolyl isomerase